MIDRLTLAEEVLILRKRARLSQGELCALAGVSRPTLIAIELGRKNVLLSSVCAVARALRQAGQPMRQDIETALDVHTGSAA